ncbi:hypothetical protein WUBG_13784 [Wuchereria bancrofti]|uniref:Uncharacterized protein n=1 Tax=Wuchereria bancrofti TaxID=6293 RepID=J9DZM0_WUCBA|nr:hypothetical protein WUBG_13784 [Wuchereria bancrofti]
MNKGTGKERGNRLDGSLDCFLKKPSEIQTGWRTAKRDNPQRTNNNHPSNLSFISNTKTCKIATGFLGQILLNLKGFSTPCSDPSGKKRASDLLGSISTTRIPWKMKEGEQFDDEQRNREREVTVEGTAVRAAEGQPAGCTPCSDPSGKKRASDLLG